VIFAIALLVYSFVAYLYLHGILVVPGYHASASTLGDWINHVSTVVLIAVILTIFVYSYNKANEQFIFDLEKTNKEIHKQDQILKQSLLEKNVMIQEIHHRVKNNLAVVSGLLELQARSDNDERIKYVFSKSNNRIMSIAKVHEMLYESSDFSDIPFEKYVQELSNIVVNSINKEDKVINFDFDIQVDSLNINHGVPLGIIFNELITNSIKYGFVDSNDNVISISVLNSIDEIKVVYSDNGIGIPDLETTSGNSLGFTLIHSLMDQIGAKFEYDTIGKFQLTFQFPISNNAGPYQS
jgi:two-component sensor histidine kinase